MQFERLNVAVMLGMGLGGGWPPLRKYFLPNRTRPPDSLTEPATLVVSTVRLPRRPGQPARPTTGVCGTSCAEWSTLCSTGEPRRQRPPLFAGAGSLSARRPRS
jgi:hypothetical protein